LTPPAPTDAIIYEPEAIRIGVLLFGTRICTLCELPLPANGDYFAPSMGGLKSACRRCTRGRYREVDAVRAKARRRAKKVGT
jgi:hypothetical protein